MQTMHGEDPGSCDGIWCGNFDLGEGGIHHNKQWRGKNAKEPEDLDPLDDEAAEPQDFLEKIFQIPFWLEPLEKKATAKYLRALTAPAEQKE